MQLRVALMDARAHTGEARPATRGSRCCTSCSTEARPSQCSTRSTRSRAGRRACSRVHVAPGRDRRTRRHRVGAAERPDAVAVVGSRHPRRRASRADHGGHALQVVERSGPHAVAVRRRRTGAGDHLDRRGRGRQGGAPEPPDVGWQRHHDGVERGVDGGPVPRPLHEQLQAARRDGGVAGALKRAAETH